MFKSSAMKHRLHVWYYCIPWIIINYVGILLCEDSERHSCPPGQLLQINSTTGETTCCFPVYCSHDYFVRVCLQNGTADVCTHCPEGTTLAYGSNSFHPKSCYNKPSCAQFPEMAAIDSNTCECNRESGLYEQAPENTPIPGLEPNIGAPCQPIPAICGKGRQPMKGTCEGCPPGYFKSNNSDYGLCQQERNCSMLGLKTKLASTATSNTVCEDPFIGDITRSPTSATTTQNTVITPAVEEEVKESDGEPPYYWIAAVVSVAILLAVGIIAYCKRDQIRNTGWCRSCHGPGSTGEHLCNMWLHFKNTDGSGDGVVSGSPRANPSAGSDLENHNIQRNQGNSLSNRTDDASSNTGESDSLLDPNSRSKRVTKPFTSCRNGTVSDLPDSCRNGTISTELSSSTNSSLTSKPYSTYQCNPGSPVSKARLSGETGVERGNHPGLTVEGCVRGRAVEGLGHHDSLDSAAETGRRTDEIRMDELKFGIEENNQTGDGVGREDQKPPGVMFSGKRGSEKTDASNDRKCVRNGINTQPKRLAISSDRDGISGQNGGGNNKKWIGSRDARDQGMRSRDAHHGQGMGSRDTHHGQGMGSRDGQEIEATDGRYGQQRSESLGLLTCREETSPKCVNSAASEDDTQKKLVVDLSPANHVPGVDQTSPKQADPASLRTVDENSPKRVDQALRNSDPSSKTARGFGCSSSSTRDSRSGVTSPKHDGCEAEHKPSIASAQRQLLNEKARNKTDMSHCPVASLPDPDETCVKQPVSSNYLDSGICQDTPPTCQRPVTCNADNSENLRNDPVDSSQNSRSATNAEENKTDRKGSGQGKGDEERPSRRKNASGERIPLPERAISEENAKRPVLRVQPMISQNSSSSQGDGTRLPTPSDGMVTQPAFDYSRAVGDNNDLHRARDLPRAANDLPRAANDLPRAANDLPRAANDLPRATYDLPRATSAESTQDDLLYHSFPTLNTNSTNYQ